MNLRVTHGPSVAFDIFRQTLFSWTKIGQQHIPLLFNKSAVHWFFSKKLVIKPSFKDNKIHFKTKGNMVSDPYFRIQFKMESKKLKQEKSADSCTPE